MTQNETKIEQCLIIIISADVKLANMDKITSIVIIFSIILTQVRVHALIISANVRILIHATSSDPVFFQDHT